jgi:hypothetical protein
MMTTIPSFLFAWLISCIVVAREFARTYAGYIQISSVLSAGNLSKGKQVPYPRGIKRHITWRVLLAS